MQGSVCCSLNDFSPLHVSGQFSKEADGKVEIRKGHGLLQKGGHTVHLQTPFDTARLRNITIDKPDAGTNTHFVVPPAHVLVRICLRRWKAMKAPGPEASGALMPASCGVCHWRGRVHSLVTPPHREGGGVLLHRGARRQEIRVPGPGWPG